MRGSIAMIARRRGAALLLGALLACQAERTPESSSSSHWFRCQALAQCADAPAAVACVAGYCVDDDGQRIPRNEVDQGDASEPALATDAAPEQIRVDDPSQLPDEPDPPGGAQRDAGGAQDAAAASDVATEPPLGARSLRVTVRNSDGPWSGTPMVLHDEQGAAVEQLRSDATGSVESERATAMVTLRAEAMGELVSYLGLQPGDRLEAAGPWWSSIDGRTMEVYRASVPALPAGADQVKVRGLQAGCLPWGEGTGGPMLLESWSDQCRGSSTALLATSLRTKSGLEDIGIYAYEVLGYSWLDQVATPQAGRIDDVQFPSWRPPARAEVVARNVPSAYNWQWHFLWWWRGAERFDAEAGSERLWFWHPPELTHDLEAAQGMGATDAQGEQWQYTKHVRVAPSARIEIDMSQPLPAVEAGRIEVLDNGRLHVSWELAPGTPHADFALVELTFWTKPQPDDAPDLKHAHPWAIFVPPTLTSFTLPQLTEWLGFKELDTTKYVLRAINYYASDHIADYRAFINRPTPFYQHPEQISLLDARGVVAERGTWITPPSPLLTPIF